MPLLQSIAVGASAADRIAGLFGGGRNPNKGRESILDALDNYEKISGSLARRMLPEIENIKASGGSNQKVAQYISEQTGYTVSQITSSYKWGILTPFLNNIRRETPESVQQRNTFQAATAQTMKRAGTGGGFFGINRNLIAGIILVGLGIGGYFISRN